MSHIRTIDWNNLLINQAFHSMLRMCNNIQQIIFRMNWACVCQCVSLSFWNDSRRTIVLNGFGGFVKGRSQTLNTIHRILLNLAWFWIAFDDVNVDFVRRIEWSKKPKTVSFEIMTDFCSINHAHCKCALTESCRLCYISVVAAFYFPCFFYYAV